MPNKIFKKLLESRISSFIAESEIAKEVGHFGMQGSIRESGLGKLISQLLPSDWDIGHGKVIDSYNNQSCESDLIIFYKKILPSIFFQGSNDNWFFPIETVGFIFEVKTTSTAKEVKDMVGKFRRLKALERIAPFSEEYVPTIEIRPIPVYFALDSDLKNKTELERYFEYDENYKTDPLVKIICVLSEGIWLFRKDEEDDCYWSFYSHSEDYRYKEILKLLSVVVDQTNSIHDGGASMSRYVLPFLDFEDIRYMTYPDEKTIDFRKAKKIRNKKNP